MNYLDKPPLRIPFLWQSIAYYFDDFNKTDEGWITSTDHTLHNPFFRTQWVTCVYLPSGSYGPTARYIFYTLALLSILFRKKSGTLGIALVSVMIYSSTAAIHAITAAVAAVMQLAARLAGIRENYEGVLIDGTSQTGNLEPWSAGGPVWLPVVPLVHEADADAILAIVGFAFLCLLPMQIRSETLKKAEPAQKIIVFAWSILLFVGLVSAFALDIYVTIWSFFPKLRFCPFDQADTLPMFSNGPPAGAETWDGKDWYRWNRTIRDHFIFKNSSALLPNKCIYPCFEYSWPLRDPTDIFVNIASFSYQLPISEEFVIALYITAGVIVSLFAGANLTLFIMIYLSANRRKVRVRTGGTSFKNFYQVWSSNDHSGISRYWRLVVRGWLWIVVMIAQWPSIIANLFFIVVQEYSIWTSGLSEETFRHIGQWGVLVGAVLVFGAVWSARGEQDSPPRSPKTKPVTKAATTKLRKKATSTRRPPETMVNPSSRQELPHAHIPPS
jgi:hypothetical protein